MLLLSDKQVLYKSKKSEKYQTRKPKKQETDKTEEIVVEDKRGVEGLKRIRNDFLFRDKWFEDKDTKKVKLIRAELFKIVPKKSDWEKKLDKMFTTKGFTKLSEKEKPYVDVDKRYLRVVGRDILELRLEIISYTLRKFVKFTAYEYAIFTVAVSREVCLCST